MKTTTLVRPSHQSPAQRRVTTSAAVLIVLAGALHLVAAPQHLEHVGHGLFLLIAGLAEIAWGIAFWRRPSPALYRLGLVLAALFIVLWAMTRVVPAPFGHGPGELEAVGVLSKIAESGGFGALLALILLGVNARERRWPAWKATAAPLALAVIGAFLLYGAGLAAEQMFPWLGDQDRPASSASPGAAASAGLATSIADHTEHSAAPAADPDSYLTINVELTDDGFQPSSIFVPVGRPTRLVVRNRAATEHHFRVVGLVPRDLLWLAQDLPVVSPASVLTDDHSEHHAETSFVPFRFASTVGVKPTGAEVHAYARGGELDTVLFTATKTGTFSVRCPLHPEIVGTLKVF